MVVAVVVCDLHLPQARSLKEKRQVVQSVIGRLSSHHRISIAETAFQDLHQRSRLGMALVERSPGPAEQQVQQMRDLIESYPQLMITSWNCEFIEEVT